jgi:NADH:ubiquinone oxidoreductase subunit 2 (subunit N)
LIAVLALVIPAVGALGGVLLPPHRRLRATRLALGVYALFLLVALDSGPAALTSIGGVGLNLGPAGCLIVLTATLATLVGLGEGVGEWSGVLATVALVALTGVVLLTLTSANLITAALSLFLVTAALVLALNDADQSLEVRQVGQRFLVWLALAGCALLIAGSLDRLYARQPGPGILGPVAALSIVGWCILAAALPFSLWLPGLCGVRPTVAALAVGLLGCAAAALASGSFAANPSLLVGPAVQNGLASAAALASALGSLVALGERQPSRRFALLIGANANLSLVGLAAGLPGDASGLIWALAVQGLAAALGLACLSVGEARLAGLFWRRPAVGFGYVVAALSLVGAPLTAGYVGRWVIGSSLAVQHPGLLAEFFVASALAALPVVRLLAPIFAPTEARPDRVSALDRAAVFVALLLIVAGLIPEPILALLK